MAINYAGDRFVNVDVQYIHRVVMGNVKSEELYVIGIIMFFFFLIGLW